MKSPPKRKNNKDCGVVLSEDMSDGQDLDGIRVANPFVMNGP
jgi:predicted nucleic acid-binding protein